MADATADVLTAQPTLTGAAEQMRISALFKQKKADVDQRKAGLGAGIGTEQGSRGVNPSGQLVNSENAGAISDFNRQQKIDAERASLDGLGAKAATPADEKQAGIGSSYRQQIAEARKTVTSQVKDKAVDAAASAISKATSELLKQSWENLITSWGATLIYIDLHVFCRLVFGEKFFCKLGHEWLSMGGAGGMGGSMDIMKTPGSPTDMPMPKPDSGGGSILGLPMAGIGVLEVAAVVGLNVILLILIFISLSPFIIVISAVADPAGTLFTTVRSILGLGGSAPIVGPPAN